MTTKYECDRCHRLFDDEKEMAAMDLTQYANGIKMEHRYHFCEFCRLIAFNALTITLNGRYGGSLIDSDTVGHVPADMKKVDPLFNKEGKE